MIMTDEFKPIIRDPHKSANMLEQPVASVPVPQPPSDPIEQVLSPREVSEGLAKADPLTRHPRVSSIMLSVVFGLLLLAAAVGVWWLGVRTMDGQSYEDLVWSKFDAALPGWLEPVVHVFTISTVVIATSAIMSIIALAVLIVRKRWLLIAQLAVFGGICFAAAELLKPLLPRPYLINLESNPNNSAPSGHAMLAAACAVILLLAVPRAVRALAGVIGVVWAVTVGVSVIYGQWHRPSDVAMSILLVAGLALLALAVTRKSGMDEPGHRVSSVSVQIVGSVLITGGLLLLVYSGYVIWQVVPGLNVSASWAVQGANVSAVVGIMGVAMLAFGLLLALRQITAAPLSRLGLIGAPPAPPK